MVDKKRILVADDSQTITTLLMTALRSAGYDVTTTSDGLETYETGKAGEFDLVILDQLMPGLLGVEVIRKWHSEGIEVPVIMLTGVDDEQTTVQAFEEGAIDFVTKPFRLPELLARVRARV
jgi:DNA-binding response OmpR family regulator